MPNVSQEGLQKLEDSERLGDLWMLVGLAPWDLGQVARTDAAGSAGPAGTQVSLCLGRAPILTASSRGQRHWQGGRGGCQVNCV